MIVNVKLLFKWGKINSRDLVVLIVGKHTGHIWTVVTHLALKVHLSAERDQRLDAFHLRDAVITFLNNLEE